MKISFILNDKEVLVDTDPTKRLLDVIREVLSRKGTKEGCGIGECGACTVLVEDVPVNSCIYMVAQAEGKHITTIEGLSENTIADVIKKCFVEEGAIQCGFCTPGFILSAYALLIKNPKPTQEEIKIALSGNLCRCTGYRHIINAVKKASEAL